MPQYSISILLDHKEAPGVTKRWIRRAVVTALEQARSGPGELSIRLTDDEGIRALNQAYRGLDETTDVLAFPLGEPFPLPPRSRRYLGDVLVSYSQVQRQALEAGREVRMELAYILVHGVLHLLGYDHAEPQERALMRAQEEAVLATMMGPGSQVRGQPA